MVVIHVRETVDKFRQRNFLPEAGNGASNVLMGSGTAGVHPQPLQSSFEKCRNCKMDKGGAEGKRNVFPRPFGAVPLYWKGPLLSCRFTGTGETPGSCHRYVSSSFVGWSKESVSVTRYVLPVSGSL